MHFMLLVHTNMEVFANYTEAEQEEITGRHREAAQEMARRGALVDANRLYGAASARLVRGGAGGPVVSDGPFAETKEQLGGYYVVQCASEQEAIELAALIPTVDYGVIEVRRVYD